MKNLVSAVILTMTVVMFGCQLETETVILPREGVNTNETSGKDAVAQQLVELLRSDGTSEYLIGSLKEAPTGIALKDLMDRMKGQGSKSNGAHRLRETAVQWTGRKAEDGSLEVLELWMHLPKGEPIWEDLLVTYVPDNIEENENQPLKAYDREGNILYLDAQEAPDRPVVVIETQGYAALLMEVEKMNGMLRSAGLQHSSPKYRDDLSQRNAGAETTKLNKIEVKDNGESWVLGASEIFAVTSGIRTADNAPELKVIPMHYLSSSEKAYYPNQIMLFWDDYAYQAANIQLFEKDNNYNYKELTSVLISGVTQIAGSLSAQPWVSALGQIAGAIVQVLPDSFFTNDDDYIDSFYTIEKGKSYTGYYGAAGNAKVDLEPHFIRTNR